MLFSRKSRGQPWERVHHCLSAFKGRVRKLLEELEGSVEDKRDWLVAVQGHVAGFRYCYEGDLQRKIIKPKSIQWNVSQMKMQWRRGVATWRFLQTHSATIKKT